MYRIPVTGQRGFVLPMALIVLTLLTLLALTLYFSGRSGIQTSATAQRSTQAFYFAEAGINYMTWALNNDADFDSFNAGGAYAFSASEPTFPANAAQVGDYTELLAYLWYPGPAIISDTQAAGKSGQMLYFDNTPMGSRYICAENAANFPNCIDFSLPASQRVSPVMANISTHLPRYIKLEMTADGTISPSIPKLPHRTPPVVGEDVPKNGAIVWLTAGTASKDIELFPLDPSDLYGGTNPALCLGGLLPSCPCNRADAAYTTAQACDANTGNWLASYGLVAYAIGYVDGRPTAIVRAVVM